MLSSYRVIELSDESVSFCGYLLAMLGAEVICVEPPGGSKVRDLPPFSQVNGESLWWNVYSRGKQRVTIDLNEDSGRSELMSMIADADFLIESMSAGAAGRIGIDYESLAKINPKIINVSVTPFGRTGPKADWPATDLTIWASAGAHALAGDSDRAPVRTSVPQAYLHAGADAAGGALIALQQRHKSGKGQHVDVSAQQSSAQAALSANLATPNNSQIVVQRMAGGLAGAVKAKLTWPTLDGYVAIAFLFGPAFTEPNRRLLAWVHEAGCCSEEDVQADWGARLMAMANGEESFGDYFELCDKIEVFTSARRQDDLFEEGIKRGIYIAPARDITGLLSEHQFDARDFWHHTKEEALQGEGGRQARVPGAFAKFSANPIRIPELEPSMNDKAVDKENRREAEETLSDTSREKDLPLAGLKVLDFMWVIAGPLFTRLLSDYGATVIKVESSTRTEPARAQPAFKNDEPGLETGTPFANFNAGKLGITVDPSNPIGKEVIEDLVRWADVVTESFSPKAMKGWGLDYESLRRINPEIIMLSSCLMGQTGPRSQLPGYGNMAAAITGFYDLTGWEDRSPAGPYLAYTDGVAPRFMLASVMSAIEHRRATGEGQYIDISQAEAAIHFLAPAILDSEVNDHVWHRQGNRDLGLAPHGVYPVKGDDQWIAIACQDDQAWIDFCAVAGFDQLSADPELKSSAGRLKKCEMLDALIEGWSAVQDGELLQSKLIEAGVAAHIVQNSPECMVDPQLSHREHFVSVPHVNMGDFIIEGTRFKLSRTPGGPKRANPEIGEHNAYVLTEILGYDVDRMADVFASLAMS